MVGIIVSDQVLDVCLWNLTQYHLLQAMLWIAESQEEINSSTLLLSAVPQRKQLN